MLSISFSLFCYLVVVRDLLSLHRYSTEWLLSPFFRVSHLIIERIIKHISVTSDILFLFSCFRPMNAIQMMSPSFPRHLHRFSNFWPAGCHSKRVFTFLNLIYSIVFSFTLFLNCILKSLELRSFKFPIFFILTYALLSISAHENMNLASFQRSFCDCAKIGMLEIDEPRTEWKLEQIQALLLFPCLLLFRNLSPFA